MIPRILATLVLDGARRYAPALVEIPPEAPLPRLAETPAAGRGELALPPILISLTWRLRNDQCLTALGRYSLRSKFPRL